MSDPSYQPGVYRKQGGNELVVTAAGTLTLEAGATISGNFPIKSAKTEWFNLDNGAGTTVDDVILRCSKAITLTAARIVYVDVTSGTVAAGSVAVGTTVGGTDLVATTNYENAKAVGTQTALVLAAAAVAAGGAVFVRHTGVAATAVGQAFVEIEYTVNS